MNRIRDLRTDADLKQKDLAEKIGISQKSLSRYETEQTIVDAETLKKIAIYFNVSMDYIMGKTNNPKNENLIDGLTSEEIKKLIEYKDMLIAYRKRRKFDTNKSNIND